MGTFSKVNGTIIKLMEAAAFSIKAATILLEITKKTKEKVSGHTFLHVDKK